MRCAHIGCTSDARDRWAIRGSNPRYCAEHGHRKWVVWRQRHKAVPPREPVMKDVRDRSKPRTRFAIVMDLRSQLCEMLSKWERRFAEWEEL